MKIQHKELINESYDKELEKSEDIEEVLEEDVINDGNISVIAVSQGKG